MLQHKVQNTSVEVVLHVSRGIVIIVIIVIIGDLRGVRVYLKGLLVEICVVANLRLPGLAEQDKFLE